jgi:hypothetical protein
MIGIVASIRSVGCQTGSDCPFCLLLLAGTCLASQRRPHTPESVRGT